MLARPKAQFDVSMMVTDNEETAGSAAAARAAMGHDKRSYVRGMFSDIAPRYDFLNHVLSLNIDRGWRREALEALCWTAASHGIYLDLCAGTLDVGAALTAESAFRGFVVGADFALPMLRAGVGKAPADTLAPVGADALALPFADSTIDGAIVAFGIRNVADLDAGLREVRRVLKAGARFVILEFSTPPNIFMRTIYQSYFRYVLPIVGRAISGHKSAYSYLPLSVAQFPTEDRLADALRSAGFEGVEWRRLTFGIAALHVAQAT